MKQIKMESQRLILMPKSLEEMEQLYKMEADEEMKKAYEEMIGEMKKLPELEVWGTDWTIALKNGTAIGGIGFKGAPDHEGAVEVGYGIDEEFRCQGYAKEALSAAVDWCFMQEGVFCVKAQTEPDNLISQKVLVHTGFVRNGCGEEGPMFKKIRHVK